MYKKNQYLQCTPFIFPYYLSMLYTYQLLLYSTTIGSTTLVACVSWTFKSHVAPQDWGRYRISETYRKSMFDWNSFSSPVRNEGVTCPPSRGLPTQLLRSSSFSANAARVQGWLASMRMLLMKSGWGEKGWNSFRPRPRSKFVVSHEVIANCRNVRGLGRVSYIDQIENLNISAEILLNEKLPSQV